MALNLKKTTTLLLLMLASASDAQQQDGRVSYKNKYYTCANSENHPWPMEKLPQRGIDVVFATTLMSDSVIEQHLESVRLFSAIACIFGKDSLIELPDRTSYWLHRGDLITLQMFAGKTDGWVIRPFDGAIVHNMTSVLSTVERFLNKTFLQEPRGKRPTICDLIRSISNSQRLRRRDEVPLWVIVYAATTNPAKTLWSDDCKLETIRPYIRPGVFLVTAFASGPETSKEADTISELGGIAGEGWSSMMNWKMITDNDLYVPLDIDLRPMGSTPETGNVNPLPMMVADTIDILTEYLPSIESITTTTTTTKTPKKTTTDKKIPPTATVTTTTTTAKPLVTTATMSTTTTPTNATVFTTRYTSTTTTTGPETPVMTEVEIGIEASQSSIDAEKTETTSAAAAAASGFPWWAWLIIAIAVLVVVALIVAIVLVMVRREKRLKRVEAIAGKDREDGIGQAQTKTMTAAATEMAAPDAIEISQMSSSIQDTQSMTLRKGDGDSASSARLKTASVDKTPTATLSAARSDVTPADADNVAFDTVVPVGKVLAASISSAHKKSQQEPKSQPESKVMTLDAGAAAEAGTTSGSKAVAENDGMASERVALLAEPHDDPFVISVKLG